MTFMTIFQFNDILVTSRNLMTGGHPEHRSCGNGSIIFLTKFSIQRRDQENLYINSLDYRG